MRKFSKYSISILFLLVPLFAAAQNAIYVYPPAPFPPVGGIQSLSFVVTGNANKTVNPTIVNGTASGCSLVGSGNTRGVKSTSTGTCVVTGTMAADGTKTAVSTVTFEPIRLDLQASSTHPRIGLTPDDITNLQSKVSGANCTSSPTTCNTVFYQGLLTYFTSIQSYYNRIFCWTGGGCGTPGPIPTGATTTSSGTITCDGFGDCTFPVISLPAGIGNFSGYTPTGFTGGGSCFNSFPSLVAATTSTSITLQSANYTCAAGSFTSSGTLTASLNAWGWVDQNNSWLDGGGGPFEEDMSLYALMALIDPVTGNRATWAAHAHDMAMWEWNESCSNAYTATLPCLPRVYNPSGYGSSTPFIGAQQILNNRSQTNTVPFAEATEWNYSSLTSGDKATIQAMAAIWLKQLTGAYELDITNGPGDHVNPVGDYSDPRIFNPSTAIGPGGTNNYAVGQLQSMAVLSMLMDPSDDPTMTGTCATSTTTICFAPNLPSFQTSHAYSLGDYFKDGTTNCSPVGLSCVQKVTTAGTSGGSAPSWNPTVGGITTSGGMVSTNLDVSDGTAQKLAAYGVYAVKGWLYRLYSVLEDSHIVNAAYGLSDPYLCLDGDASYGKTNSCTGTMSGGFVAEGTGYGYLSMDEAFEVVNVLYKAGKLNPANDPQAALISSAFWDKLAISEVTQLLPLNPMAGAPQYTQQASDSNINVFNSDKAVLLNNMEEYDAAHSSWRVGLDKWYGYSNGPFGYASFFSRYMGSGGNVGSISGNVQFVVNTLLATSTHNDGDFANANPWNPTYNSYDPRNSSTLPVAFENLSAPGGLYHYYGRSDFTTTARQFQFHCMTGWQSHASSQCGRIDYIRNNEVLTSGMGGTTTSDGLSQAPLNQNMVGYQWNPATSCNQSISGVEEFICDQGGQVDNGYSIFSTAVLATSSDQSHYYGAVDGTGGYNTNIVGCAHCPAYANVNLGQREVFNLGDFIWVYDRAETTTPTSFKNFSLDITNTATVAGQTAKTTTPNGQNMYLTALLPATASYTQGTLNTCCVANPVVTKYITDTVLSPTASQRMLHTLEGTNSGGSQTTTALIQSSSGTNFDGGVIGTTAVMFIRSRGSISSTTYAASGATNHYVTGLTPSASYNITGAGTPSTVTADSGGLINFSATGTGNIIISAGSPPPSSGIIFQGAVKFNGKSQ